MTNVHPTLARMIARFAIAETSKAKTPKGVLAAIRQHGMPPMPKSVYSARIKWQNVPFVDTKMYNVAWERSRKLNPRKSNWRTAEAVVGDSYDTGFETFRYSGQHSGRTGSYGIPQYPSYVRIARNSRAVAELHQEGKLIATRFAPKGMRWAWNEYGVHLVDKDGLDFHPTSEDFKAKDFVKRVRSGLKAKRDAERIQKQLARKNAAIAATLQAKDRLAKYWVTRDDSLIGGNCQAGTDRFIDTVNRVLGDGIGAIRADVLLDKWPSPAVEKAVRAAIARKMK